MYARVVRVGVAADRLDDFLLMFENEFVPDLERDRGFGQALVLADRSTHQVLALAMYDTLADVEASGEGFRARAQRAADLFTGPPAASTYEVAVRA